MTDKSDRSNQLVKPQILKGFRDYLPEQMLLRNRLIETIRTVFEQHGFEPLDSPALEYYDVLVGKAGENEKLMYNFEDQGGRRVGLRYDLTVPLSRIVAMHQNDIVLPFKRYHIAPVWRAEKPQRGRFREFWQCDADVAGSSSMLADAEVISVLSDSLEALHLPSFVIRISHRALLERLAVVSGIESDFAVDIFRTIDKLDKIGPDGVLAEMNRLGIPDSSAAAMMETVAQEGSSDEILEDLTGRFAEDSRGLKAVNEIRELLALLPEIGVPAENYSLDLSLARGLDYYTGPVFEATVESPQIGSVAGAGRYDNLIGSFLGRPVSATGMSLGLERLVEVVQELGLMPIDRSVADVMIVIFPDAIGESASIARDLRQAGIRADLSLQPNKSIGEQLKYADRRGIPVAIIPGAVEAAAGEVTVKILSTGQQDRISKDALVRNIADRVRP